MMREPARVRNAWRLRLNVDNPARSGGIDGRRRNRHSARQVVADPALCLRPSRGRGISWRRRRYSRRDDEEATALDNVI